MNTSTHTIRRLVKAFTLAAIVASFATATSQAGGPIDDWFRDPSVPTQTRATVPTRAIDRLVDDRLRTGGGAGQTLPTPATPTADRLVDDWFRDARAVAADQQKLGFGWSDFAVGIGAGIGLMVLLVVIGASAIRMRHAGGRLRSA